MPVPRRSTRASKHRLAFACCGVIGGLLLAGCGDDADLVSDPPTTTVTIAGPATTDAPAASSGTADRNKPTTSRKAEQGEAEADRGKAETDGENQGDRPRGQSPHHAATDPGSQGGSPKRESRDRSATPSLDAEQQEAIEEALRAGEPIPGSSEPDPVARPEPHGPDNWELYQQEHGQDEGAPDS